MTAWTVANVASAFGLGLIAIAIVQAIPLETWTLILVFGVALWLALVATGRRLQ